jgi:hypothetical protein
MKTHIIAVLTLLSTVFYCFSQEKIEVYSGGSVLYQNSLLHINSIEFRQGNSFFNLIDNGLQTIPLSEIDSITFVLPAINGPVIIIFNGNSVDIQNPYETGGVSIIANQSTVTVNSTIENEITYIVSGSTADGSLTIASSNDFKILLDNAALTASALPAIQITSAVTAEIQFNGTNILSDGTGNTKNAPLISKGKLIFNGYGALQVAGLKKHAISSDQSIQVEKGNITISSSASDGFHCEGFSLNDGDIRISSCAGDGIDAGSATVEITNGTIQINSAAGDVKGIKSDEDISIKGGTIELAISGAQSKGVSSKKNIGINNGNITVVCSGAAVLPASGSGYDPSYCTAIKSDGTTTINGGTIQLTCTNTANGGKGISAGENIVINSGTVHITTAGNGAVYTNKSGTTDSYTSACLTSDQNILILGGAVTCQSSGTGGKAINADGAVTIGNAGADDSMLMLTAGTSGERFLVSGNTGGGGGGPGGGGPGGGGGQNNADYANPKGIKATGNLTVNSGTIRINCTQTTEGGEGMESKGAFIINGGDIEIHSYDDPINGGTSVTVNGGKVFAAARANDAIDSNGTLAINGGLVIVNGVKGDGEGIDSERSYSLNGGILLASSGSTMCNPVGPQKAVRYTSAKAGQAICIKNAAGETIVMYNIPVIAGASSGTTLIFVFTDPRLVQGTYTLQYGGTITGGVNENGYVTGGAYSGGSTKNFTIGSAAYTSVN